MKRHHLVGLAALSLGIALGADASAQTPNQPPPNPPAGTPSQPPPMINITPSTPSTPPPGAPPAAAAAPGSVRVHFRTEKNKKKANIYLHASGDTWTPVCTTPCSADLPAHSELRVVYDNNEAEPHDVTISSELGSEVDLEIKPASLGPLIGGVVMMGVGGGLVVSGLLFLAVASLDDSVDSSFNTGSSGVNRLESSTTDAYRVAGWVCIGIGAAAAVGGLVLLLTRSKEPRTFDTGYHGEGDNADKPDKRQKKDEAYDRNATVLGDMAAVRRADPLTLKPAFAPFSYGFTF